MKNKVFNKFYNNPKGRILFSILLASLLCVIAYNSTYITYTTADDENAINAIAGYKTGTESIAVYLNYYLSLFLDVLYKMFPNLPVYSLFQVLLIFISITIIFFTIFSECAKRKSSFLLAFSINILVFLTQYWYICVRMHFRTTATMVGIASMALIYLASSRKYTVYIQIILYAFSAIMLALCFMYSKDNGYLICCYLLLIITFLFGKYILFDRSSLKNYCLKTLTYGLITSLLIIFLVLSGKQLMNSWNGKEYTEYNRYRISYQDYQNSSYEENEEVYRSIGWSKSFFNLTKLLYYMDEKFNAENLSKLVKEFSWSELNLNQENGQNTQSLNRDALWVVLTDLFRNEAIAKALFVVYIAIFLLSLLSSCKNRSKINIYTLLFITGSVIGTIVIYIFLCLKGRMILRAYHSFVLPALFTSLLLGLNQEDGERKNIVKNNMSNKTPILQVCSVFPILAAIAINCIWTGKVIYSSEIKSSYMNRRNINDALEAYTTKHKDNFYILSTRVGNSFYPFTVKGKGDLVNISHWGGGPMGTGVYNEQLNAFGINRLTSDSFFEDDVYLITSYPANMDLYYLIDFLNEEYDELITFKVIDSFENLFVVLKAEKHEMPENGYIRFGDYYYYIENGKIKEGSFMVDGILCYSDSQEKGCQYTMDDTGGYLIPAAGIVQVFNE